MYLGPGQYSLNAYSPGGSVSRAMELIPGQREQEIDLHVAELRTSPKTMSGAS